MIEFRNPYHIEPPGVSRQILSHPTNETEAIELAVFQEHRYAFFYWNKWMRKNESANPPCLVSLDWHQDLCYPCETEKEKDNLQKRLTKISGGLRSTRYPTKKHVTITKPSEEK